MKSYFAVEKIEKDGKIAITTKIDKLSIADAEVIGLEMGMKNSEFLNGKIENKSEEIGYQFFNAFVNSFFLSTLYHAPKRIKDEVQKSLNENLFSTEEENKTE